MTTLTQETYAHKLVAALNERGFVAIFDGEDQEYAPTIVYSKNGIFGKTIFVCDLIKKEWADSMAIKEEENSITEDVAHCESEIEYAIKNGAVSTENMSEEEYLDFLYK